MAKITITDQWLTDPRRFKLMNIVGNEQLADGIMVAAWVCAQGFWRNGKRPIPKPVFDRLPYSKDIFEAGLAKHSKGGIYLRGSTVAFQWLIEAQETGRRGGRASGESRKRKAEGFAKGLRRVCEPTNTNTNTNTSTKELNTNTLTQQVERIYQELYPRKIGKSKGIKKLSKLEPEEITQLEKAVKNYAASVAGDEPKFIKHFSTFASEWKDWVEYLPPEKKPAVDLWAEKEQVYPVHKLTK